RLTASRRPQLQAAATLEKQGWQIHRQGGVGPAFPSMARQTRQVADAGVVMQKSDRWLGALCVLFFKCRRIAFHDNPAKQSVSPCNKPTHDKPAKFLHYCG
ncbi:hypothetical protein, partial [Azospirillum sp. B506]|uniref:hypothetical protein n=1 Tax=Azospirillum sp. B506 TaxID=137721 RepID=UPI00131EE404